MKEMQRPLTALNRDGKKPHNRQTRRRTLRIAHVTGVTSLKYGGFEQFMVAVAKECSRRGHRFYCLWENCRKNEELYADLADAGAESIVMPARGRPLRFLGEIALWLNRTRIDVMHSYFNPASVLALAAARLVRVPLPLWTLRSGLPEHELINNLPWRFRMVMRARWFLAARVFTVSRAVGKRCRKLGFGGRRSKARYTGVLPLDCTRSSDEMRTELGLTPENLVIVCVAFHHPMKGVDILIRALGLLAPQFPQLRLVEVGGPWDPAYPEETNKLQTLAEEMGVADRIIWTGYRNDVRNILECADLYCQPSRIEGLPMAVLEAMNAALPVVATRVGGMPEEILDGQTGLLTEQESSESLADALASLLRDESRRQQMGQMGRQRLLQMFDLRRQTKLLIDMYEDMIEQILLWQSLAF